MNVHSVISLRIAIKKNNLFANGIEHTHIKLPI